MEYESEYKYYLRCYIDMNTAKMDGNPTKEMAIVSALAEYDTNNHTRPMTHQEFEAELIRMVG